MITDDLVRYFATVLILGALIVLTYEVRLLRSIWLYDKTIVAIRERIFASFCRLSAASIGAVVILDNILNINLINETVNYVLVATAIVVLAIPAARFIRLYTARGFRSSSNRT
jgi:hypothetical protein